MGLEWVLDALTPANLLLALAGVVAGTAIGAIPGLSATMAVAVLVPLTFTMPPATALILMGAIYSGAIYGGAYSAILLNTPGTPSAIATTLDGYPMARRGDGDLAMTIACLASVFGGLIGAVALLTLAPPLSRIALAFGPVEYFWLAIFGLSLIAALSQGSILKGMIGGAFGLILSCIGVAEVSADVRLTFGSEVLLGGIHVVAGLIGLYCIPVLIDLVATPERHLQIADAPRGFRLREALAIVWRDKVNLVRSSVIGTLVGILPGAGGSVAGLVAYSEAQRSAKPGQRYGEGEPGGIIASRIGEQRHGRRRLHPDAGARHSRNPARRGHPRRAARAGTAHRPDAVLRRSADRLHLHLGAAAGNAADPAGRPADGPLRL